MSICLDFKSELLNYILIVQLHEDYRLHLDYIRMFFYCFLFTYRRIVADSNEMTWFEREMCVLPISQSCVNSTRDLWMESLSKF